MKTQSIDKAIRLAEKKYERIEQMRSREATLNEVRRLVAAGVSNPTIADLMGVDKRTIERIRSGHVEEVKPPKAFNFNTDQSRADKLEKFAAAGFDLACKLRDEDPQLVWETLLQLNEQTLMELTMILLAGLPVDRPASEIFGWLDREIAS